MPPRARYTYTQTVIGICGHLCEGWGAVHRLGEPLPWVACEICSAKDAGVEQYVVGETPVTMVRVAPKDAKKEVAKRTPRKAAVKPKRKPHAWEVFLANE